MTQHPQPHRIARIAVVAFDQISSFHLSAPCVVFKEAMLDQTRFELCVCSCEGSQLSTTAGYNIIVDHSLDLLEAADIIIVPSWRNPDEKPPEHLLSQLIHAHARGTMIVGLCLGAYVLAEAGLLNGKQATTHWEYSQHFSARFPQIKLCPDVLYIQEGQVITSAGTAAGIDCCMHILRQHLGAETANRIARRLVVPPHRQGGQAQFIEQPLPVSGRDTGLTELIDWIRANLHLRHDLDSLSQRAHMSRRTFTRHFRQLTGCSVSKWLLNERLSLTQRLLESTPYSMDEIAAKAGFGSTVSMRQQFKQVFGVSPNVWRKMFNAPS